MAEVIFASSYDERNPPSNIFSSNKKEFFSSTGMFPQELCIQFETEKVVRGITITSYGIKRVEIQTCENDSVVNFTKQAEQSERTAGYPEQRNEGCFGRNQERTGEHTELSE